MEENSVVKDYLTTADDGKSYTVLFYSLPMILAVGFRVRGPRGVQFRRWANSTLRDYLQKGFLIDDERLKNPDGRPDYFDELLERIREIRASEKRFYQKVRDIFTLCADYDPTDKATQMFFAETQNKLLYAATLKTAAEIVVGRADPKAPNMALTAWQGSRVRKGDVVIAKNYLTADEIDTPNRLTVIFLETAELRVKNRQPMMMDFWKTRVDSLIADNGFHALDHSGKITAVRMERIAHERYEQFNDRRKTAEAAAADDEDQKNLESLQQLEQSVKKRARK